MMRQDLTFRLALLALFGFFLCWMRLAGATPTAAQIIDRCDKVEYYKSNYAEMQQIITTSSGAKRTLVARSWAIDNGDKQLSEYLSPADIKGQKILMTDDGDNIWMFNAETRRTRKLGSHMKKKKVMGSDFTYEDNFGGSIREKFTPTLLGSAKEGGVECWHIKLIPTAKGPSYDKLAVWIGKGDSVTRRVDFYQDGEQQPFKRLLMTDIQPVKQRRVPMRMTMVNLQDQSQTVNVITRIVYDVEIPKSIFEARQLKK